MNVSFKLNFNRLINEKYQDLFFLFCNIKKKEHVM